jgi:hypothetical protein
MYPGGQGPGPNGEAVKVSYNRPSSARIYDDSATVFTSEYPMVRFLEHNGYDVSYLAGVDTDRYGAKLLPMHKVFLSVGHDEYVSGQQRNNIQAAIAHGVNVGYFSGNENSWKTRWEASIAGPSTSYRTLVCYKETASGQDPSGIWTGHWGDPAGGRSAGKPGNALDGQLFHVINSKKNPLSITVPSSYGTLRFWRNTSIAAQSPGSTVSLGTATLGYESDIVPDDRFRPAGLFTLSYTAENNVGIWHPGNVYVPGSASHQLSLYRAPSGALVFGAGTIQWSWGLDSTHDSPSGPADPNMQQATVNLFADMGVQPATLQAGLVAAAASTDTVAPTSGITSPAQGATLPRKQPSTITVNATDAGGGVVAGVEVSIDDGVTWHPATGSEPWTFTWTPSTAHTTTILSRAVDDSGNLEHPQGGVTVTVS